MNRIAIVGVCCLALALSFAGGCKKGEEGGEAKAEGGEAKAEGGEAAGGEPVELTLAKLDNIKGTAPAGSKAEDGIVGGVSVTGPDLVVGIDVANEFVPATLEEAKKDFTETYQGVTNIKEEKLADGYLFTAENKGGAGTNYWVKSRREIGGKAYSCETTASRPEQQASAAAFCKSLKK